MFESFKNMFKSNSTSSRVEINGNVYEGDCVVAINGRVTINGVDVGSNFGKQELTIRILGGSIKTLTTDRSVTCLDVTGNIKAGGSVTCDAVGGSVTSSGSVSCDDIDGNVDAGGSVSCDDIMGSVNAGGSISR
jgi:hypothetical protein